MKYNEFAKKLLKMDMGTSLTLKKKTGEEEGVFIRIPSGWVYRYMSRHGTTSCFIPYTDEFQFYDDNMKLKPCINCKATQIFQHYDTDKDVYFIYCDSCNARTGNRKKSQEAVTLWNMQN